MRKKYLNTIEDIEALRNTNTKIYTEIGDVNSYLQFVNGWPCRFYKDGNILFGCGFFFSQKPYIKVEDEQDYIGKLGWFWDDDTTDRIFIDVLVGIEGDGFKYLAKGDGCHWQHFRPLTPEEVEKYTGYKVVKE